MPSTPAPDVSSRLIRLENLRQPLVLPVSPISNAMTFTPFPLPSFALSQACWLAGLADFCIQTNFRCLAVLLILNVQTRQWALPVVPSQRCSAEGSPSGSSTPGVHLAFPPLMSFETLSRLLQVGRSTLYRWKAMGHLEGTYPVHSGEVRFDRRLVVLHLFNSEVWT